MYLKVKSESQNHSINALLPYVFVDEGCGTILEVDTAAAEGDDDDDDDVKGISCCCFLKCCCCCCWVWLGIEEGV